MSPLAVVVSVSLVALAAAVLRFFVLSERAAFNRAGVFGSDGRITTGEALGVRVGARYADAVTEFSRLGFEYTEPYAHWPNCWGERDEPVPSGCAVHLWRDPSWRKGMFCVLTKGEEIAGVHWRYGMGQL